MDFGIFSLLSGENVILLAYLNNDLQLAKGQNVVKCRAVKSRNSISKGDAIYLRQKSVEYLFQIWNLLVPQVEKYLQGLIHEYLQMTVHIHCFPSHLTSLYMLVMI